MTGVKRTRSSHFSADAETVQSTSFASRKRNNKRARLSQIHEDDVPTSSDDASGHSSREDSGDDARRDLLTAASVRSQFDLDVEQDSPEASDDEAEMLRATQRMQKMSSQYMDNRAADGGVIESVTCINFMCHTKLHVTLGPLINFIIGHNGSGKSAVLTAITLCLGGKATTTNRGQNLKSFIKEGTESAVLIIKLKNQGIDLAFRHDVYGDSIIIERHFSLAGSSGFKIKSANGRIITTKRAELDDITDHYNLQMDNPVNVLTQDQARQFLNSSTPSDKYRFFIRGVQLERLHQDYEVLMETLDGVASNLKTLTEDETAHKKAAEAAKEKKDLFRQGDQMRSKKHSLARQMAWAQVEEQEKILGAMKRDAKKAAERVVEKQVATANAEQLYEHSNQAFEQAVDNHTQIETELALVQEEKTKATETADLHKAEQIELQASHREIKGLLDAAKAQRVQSQRNVDEEQSRLDAASGGGHTAKLVAIEQAEHDVEKSKDQADVHARKLPLLEQRKRASELKHRDYLPGVHTKQDELNEAEHKLKTLQQSEGSQRGGYDRNIETLLRAIRNETSFQTKPVGPLGYHVRLKQPEWSSILETTFGNALEAFVVTSKGDQKILSELTRRCSMARTTILIGRAAPIDTIGREPDARFDTIMRVLDIDNDLVRNQLIINQSIENIILFKDPDEGFAAMYNGERPRNVKVCLVFHPKRRGLGQRYKWGAGGGPATDPINPWSRAPRMKTDIEYQVNTQREVVKSLEQEFREIQVEVRRLESVLKTVNQDISKHKADARKLDMDLQRAEDHCIQLKDELERDVPQDGKLDALKQQFAETEEECAHHQGALAEAEQNRAELQRKAAPLNAAVHEVNKRVEKAEANVKKAAARITRAAEARTNALRAKNEAIATIEDAKAEQKTLEEKLDEFEVHVTDFTAEATRFCDRVPIEPGATAASLDAKMSIVARDIRAFENSMGGDERDIVEAASKAMKTFNATRANLQELRKVEQKLLQSLNDRRCRWVSFRQAITARARGQFMYLMSERAFHGKMSVSHSQKMLDLHADPEVTRRSSTSQARQTKSLSGGEKSFSTICLLLALWDAMGSPIRCLDEFDVFMDSVNRDVSMRMMISAARRSVGRQYILITPQAMNNLDSAGDVKIIRLSDPERGQTSLAFPPAAWT